LKPELKSPIHLCQRIPQPRSCGLIEAAARHGRSGCGCRRIPQPHSRGLNGTDDSDLDMLVDFRAPVGLKQGIGDAIGLAVDLVMKETLKRRIGQRILSEAVML
jgi:hypothetical protein